MIRLNVPDSAWSTANFVLGETLYEGVFTYNSRDKRWRLSLYREGQPVIRGLKLMENQPLLNRYVIDNWGGGEIFTLRSKDDGEPVSRDNLGLNKSYELVYFTQNEVNDFSD